MNQIAKVAFHGMHSGDLEVTKACLEKIFIMATDGVSEEIAAKKMNDSQQDKINADDQLGSQLIEKYGKYKGYSKFVLALDFFQMSNDRFFEIYKFNFVPHGKLYERARDYILERQMSSLDSDSQKLNVAVPSGYIDSNLMADKLMKSFGNGTINNSFKLGS
ncbi:hypothetical protein P7D72_01765 [Enterococcus avium]|uniref:hypothetical protein n=1 Tax=Enterococcus avium TaxID=33945 RepID=UPI0028916858|nr:hypothetical protein [Enterococcus avium]MDT2490774.1 hypothetical protein [Enterococcus avium]